MSIPTSTSLIHSEHTITTTPMSRANRRVMVTSLRCDVPWAAPLRTNRRYRSLYRMVDDARMVPLDTDIVAAIAAAKISPRTPTGKNVDTPTTNAF